MKNSSLSNFPMTWDESLSFVKELNHSELHGFRDWRLPNRRELFSIVSQEAVNPSLPPGHPFDNVFSSYYWTSTSCVRQPDQAWYIHLGGARLFKGMKHASYMVWPVRISENFKSGPLFQTGQQNCFNETGDMIDCHHTGQDGEFQSGLHFNKNRFTGKSDCIVDNATGLSWLKHANLYREAMDWKTACDWISQMNRERKYGHVDWRVPTIVELEGLTDMGRHSPALPADHLFIDVQDFYWSSTTSMYDTSYAWVLYMIDGAVGVGYKPLPEFYLWPVRSGISSSNTRSGRAVTPGPANHPSE